MNNVVPEKDSYFKTVDEFDAYKQMIELGNGLTLSQVCNITKLESHMIQNWVKRGFAPHPINKKYFTKHLARILLINALRECMFIEDIGSLMVYINGDVDDESDDVISEEKLYKLFANLVNEIDDLNNIDSIINSKVKDNKLKDCMKVMLYAYFAGEMSKKSHSYLQNLK